MSQDAYRQFLGEVRDGGLVLIDDSLVEPDPASELRHIGVPATRIAEDLGKRMIANMVMVGLFAGAAGAVAEEAAREAVRSSVPPGTEDTNLAAFEQGCRGRPHNPQDPRCMKEVDDDETRRRSGSRRPSPRRSSRTPRSTRHGSGPDSSP